MILVLVCILIGILLRKAGRLPHSAAHGFNTFVIWISLPALVIEKIHSMPEDLLYSRSMLFPVSMPWFSCLFACLFYYIGRRVSRSSNGESRAVLGTLFLTLAFGNTSFVGFPLLRALIGPQAIPPAVLLDQLGSFLGLSTLGIFFATGGGSIKRVLTFPAFVALVFALAMKHVVFFPALEESISALSATLVPVALISVGVQLDLKWSAIRPRIRWLGLGLFLKLVVFPITVALFYRLWIQPDSLNYKVIVLESAMAPMITAGILASESGFDSELSSLMVGVGIPLSLVTVPIWSQILKWV